MYQDPLFLIGLMGAIGCIGWWILDNLRGEGSEELEEKLNRIGLIFSVLIIWRLFVNAGDLGILLFFGSIICLLILLVGVIASNSRLTKTGRSWFIPVFLIFALRTFAYEPFQIPSGSMLPGLKVGDFLLVNKHVYGYKINRIGEPSIGGRDPEYGDVVVFVPPHVNAPFVKRLIGKPGDVIRYQNKKLYVNNIPLDQQLISSKPGELIIKETFEETSRIIRLRETASEFPYEVTVPSGHYFVMGDNRDNSSDSRIWGFVPRENFMGTAEVIWATWECWLCLPSFERAGKIK
jgi:signal peptidase I|tara:strand:+ start:234 stop:1109 length:876 start_codon:yes stop_codon:yes gene_type:complete